MKKLLSIALFLCFSAKGFAQINLSDSTVQVISYWDNKEKQTYHVTHEKYKVKGADTSAREFTSYDVEISIKDSTANSYTVEWLYKNVDIRTENKFTKKLASITDNLPIVIKTNEMGAFQEVVNWVEVRDLIRKSIAVLREEFKDVPKIKEIAGQVEGMFSTKEAIEAGAIKDIQQFYTFHGGKYKLGEELNGTQKIANLYGGEPMDSELSVLLEEINEEDDNAVLRYWQTIDRKQATDATYGYVKQLAAATGVPSPERSSFPEFSIEDRVAARMHGPSGWPIYSSYIREIKAEDTSSFEERIIEIK